MLDQSLRARARDVAAQVRRAYGQYWRADLEYRVHLEHVALMSRIVDMSRGHYQTGHGSQQDLLRLTVELSQLHNDVATLEQERQSSRALLNVLMGRAPEAPLGPPPEDAIRLETARARRRARRPRRAAARDRGGGAHDPARGSGARPGPASRALAVGDGGRRLLVHAAPVGVQRLRRDGVDRPALAQPSPRASRSPRPSTRWPPIATRSRRSATRRATSCATRACASTPRRKRFASSTAICCRSRGAASSRPRRSTRRGRGARSRCSMPCGRISRCGSSATRALARLDASRADYDRAAGCRRGRRDRERAGARGRRRPARRQRRSRAGCWSR